MYTWWSILSQSQVETFYNSLLKQKKMRQLGAAFKNWLIFTPNLGDMIQLDSYLVET